jgi:hypothetical protein
MLRESKALIMRLALIPAMFTFLAFGQDTPPLWDVEVKAGKTAFAFGNYPMAVQRYPGGAEASGSRGRVRRSLLPILHALAIALRTDTSRRKRSRCSSDSFPSRGECMAFQGLPTATYFSDICAGAALPGFAQRSFNDYLASHRSTNAQPESVTA